MDLKSQLLSYPFSLFESSVDCPSVELGVACVCDPFFFVRSFVRRLYALDSRRFPSATVAAIAPVVCCSSACRQQSHRVLANTMECLGSLRSLFGRRRNWPLLRGIPVASSTYLVHPKVSTRFLNTTSYPYFSKEDAAEYTFHRLAARSPSRIQPFTVRTASRLASGRVFRYFFMPSQI